MKSQGGKFKQHYLFAVFLLVSTVLLFKKSDGYFGWTKPSSKEGTVLISDGAAYYSYLPAWFIYGNDDFAFMERMSKRYSEPGFNQNIHNYPGTNQPYNKYYTGTAIAMSPFFGIAHGIAKVAGYPDDGYSTPYLLLINCAAIFYVLAGCWAIYLLLIRLGIKKPWAVAALACLVFGTNLSFYSCFAPACSHAFSFGINAWILYLIHCLATSYIKSNWYLVCLLFALAIVIRPTNAFLLLFVPFLFQDRKSLFEFIRQQITSRSWQLIGGFLPIVGLVFFQCYTTWCQIGKWSFGGYPGEGFDFLFQPKIWQVLFSWDKGLFVFAPVLLLILPGTIILFRERRQLFWGTTIFFALFTWITASWWCWWYGGGLGMRPYIEFFPILIIPIAFLLNRFPTVNKVLVLAFAAGSCWLYSTYEWQMRHNILDYDRMTYEEFSHVFLETDLRFSWGMHMEYEHLPQRKPIVSAVYLLTDASGNPPKKTRMLGDDPNDNPRLVISPVRDPKLLTGVQLTGQFFLYSGETNPYVEVSYFRNGAEIYWHQYYLGQFIEAEGKWSPVKLDLYPPDERQDFDSLKIVVNEANTFTGMKNWKAEVRYYSR